MTDLPPEVLEEAERLTRLAREVVDDAEATAYVDERDALLDSHDFTARIRADYTGDVLVCHPQEWDAVEERNRAVAAAVEEDHGPVHGATASALADFMGNHYAKPIAEATPDELAEFKAEYFPRNAWPSDEQRALLDESVRLTVEKSGNRVLES